MIERKKFCDHVRSDKMSFVLLASLVVDVISTVLRHCSHVFAPSRRTTMTTTPFFRAAARTTSTFDLGASLPRHTVPCGQPLATFLFSITHEAEGGRSALVTGMQNKNKGTDRTRRSSPPCTASILTTHTFHLAAGRFPQGAKWQSLDGATVLLSARWCVSYSSDT
jgi:hypothetical protein